MMRSLGSLNRQSNNSFLLFLLPFIVVLVLVICITLIISIIWMISVIGVFLIAFLIPISIIIILLIVVSYLSGNILYFSIFFDDYTQKVFIFKILQNISNFQSYGVQDIYQLVINLLFALRKYSNYMDSRRSNRNISIFNIFFGENTRRENEFLFGENAYNLFPENEPFSFSY